MGYMHIENLYKNKDILLFRECYALEKIHGSSANIHLTNGGQPNFNIKYYGGGQSQVRFEAIFNKEDLQTKLLALNQPMVSIYGEVYGGSCQKMSDTYGKDLKFVVFDIQIGDLWLDVPNMDECARSLGLDVVHWEKVPTDPEILNALRDAPSVQALNNGMGANKKREGIVLRPPIEVTKNNGARIIAKHKRDDFQERQNTPSITDPEKQKVLEAAQAIADEWVTPMRLGHVLDKIPAEKHNTENMKTILDAMVEDVYREAKGEIVESRDAARAIMSKTALLFKEKLKNEFGK